MSESGSNRSKLTAVPASQPLRAETSFSRLLVQPFKIKPGRRKTSSNCMLPAVLSGGETFDDSLADGTKRKPKRLRLRSSMSLRKLQTPINSKEYPTLFRPQIGAVGGRTEFVAKTNNAALLIAAIATLIVANSGPMDRLVHALQFDHPTAYAAIPPQTKAVAQSLFVPMFGPAAVKSCESSCAGHEGAALQKCETDCSRLSLSGYPSLNHSAKEDGAIIVDSCVDTPMTAERSISQSAWQSATRSSYDLLRGVTVKPLTGDFAKNRLALKQLTGLLDSVTLPPPSGERRLQEFTENLARSACLRAHLSLVDIGIILAEQASDQNGTRFYSSVKQSIVRALPAVETPVGKQAKVLLAKPAAAGNQR